MARGPSGRVVVEIEPALKRALHAALAQDGRTLKDWFIARAESYLDAHFQMSLPLAAETEAVYSSNRTRESAPTTTQEHDQ
jgi:hypothetical protein